MKTQVIVSSTLAVGFMALVTFGGLGACSSSSDFKSGSGNGGGSGSSSSSSSSGAGGSVMDAGPSPLAGSCASICDHLDSIDCKAWSNCSTECVNGFNAPAACEDEVKALIDCWVANQQTFTCSMTQLIPPAACQGLESKFNECFSGSGSSGAGSQLTCEGEFKNGTDTTCSSKTTCSDMKTILKSTCTLPDGAMDWACTCYKNESVLGTCSDSQTFCDNAKGCCKPFFFLTQQ